MLFSIKFDLYYTQFPYFFTTKQMIPTRTNTISTIPHEHVHDGQNAPQARAKKQASITTVKHV